MGGRPCCCGTCCITPKPLQGTVSMGVLPDTTDLPIESGIINTTTEYEQDFEAETIGTYATDLGWTKHSGTVNPTAWRVIAGKVLNMSAPQEQAIERTFATGGTFSYDWGTDTSDEFVKIYVNDVLQNDHNPVGGGTGSNSVTVPDGGTVRIEGSTSEDDAWVDNLLLISGGGTQGCIISGSGDADTTAKGRPGWASNINITQGAWHHQNYFALNSAVDPDTGQCYRFNQTDPVVSGRRDLTSIIEAVTGNVSLVVNPDPDINPYRVLLEYYLYVNAVDHCILRVGARFYPSVYLQINEYDSGETSFSQNPDIGNVTESSYKYSDYNPCAEDYGLPPFDPTDVIPATADAGKWLSGYRYDLFSAKGPESVNQSVGGNPPPLGTLWVPGDPDDDLSFLDPYYELFAWGWEIDLTAAGISDLASLPSTTLDWTSVDGLLGASISSPLLPIPSGHFDGELEIYSPGSTTLGPNTFLEDRSGIFNGGGGGHICEVGSRDGISACGSYGIYEIHRMLQEDVPVWRFRVDVDMSTLTVLFKDFSLVIEPKP